MSAATAAFIIDRVVTVEDRHGIAVVALQHAQSLLIGNARPEIHIGLTLKNAEHERRTERRRLHLAMEEIAAAGMQATKRQVGLAYSAARPASDVLRDFIAKLEKQHPAARRGKRAAAGKRG
jgi:DNA invertase Pin-like site-specific DNA recombinase